MESEVKDVSPRSLESLDFERPPAEAMYPQLVAPLGVSPWHTLQAREAEVLLENSNHASIWASEAIDSSGSERGHILTWGLPQDPGSTQRMDASPRHLRPKTTVVAELPLDGNLAYSP
jgi:hypothetical protein